MIEAKKGWFLSNDWEMRLASAFLMVSIFGLPDVSRISIISRAGFLFAFFVYCIKCSRTVELKYSTWVACLSIWGLLNYIFSYIPSVTLTQFLTMMQAIWIGCFEYNWIRKTSRYNEVLLSIVAGGTLLCVRLLRYIDFSRWGSRKVGTMLGINVNSLGFRIAICFVILLALTYMGRKNRRLKVLGMAFCGMFVAFILITGSRRSLIICFTSTVIIMFGYANSFSKTFKSIVFVVTAVIGVYTLIMEIPELYNIIGRRFQAFLTALFSGDNYLDDGRNDMIITSIDLFWKRPLFGWGMGTFRYISGIDNAYAHNTYVELLYATGLPGVIFYYSIFMVIVGKIIKLERKSLDRVLCLALLATALVSDFVAVNYTSIVAQVVIALLMSLSERDIRNKHEDIED